MAHFDSVLIKGGWFAPLSRQVIHRRRSEFLAFAGPINFHLYCALTRQTVQQNAATDRRSDLSRISSTQDLNLLNVWSAV